ncbi:MAG: hypothetical protein IPK26_07675 [Planctomycetes bacterium]|nr:hypothetical protein [Planctomycetota bacterium]
MKIPPLHLVLPFTILWLSAPASAQGGRGRGARPAPITTALDADKNGVLSAAEITAAPTQLQTLDQNGDGRLAGEEIGARGGRGGRGGGPGGFPGGMGGGSSPLLTALDDNRDGELDAAEVRESASALLSLDADRDGQLAATELAPPRDERGGFPGGPGGPGGGFGPGRGNAGGGERVPPEDLKIEDGTATIPDRATFQTLSYQGTEVAIDTQLTGLEFVKFVLADPLGDKPALYFMNTNTHRAHPMFVGRVGIPFGRGGRGGGAMMGVLVYRPLLGSPSGKPGLYTFEFEPNDAYPFEKIKAAHDQLVAKAPMLGGNLAYHPLPAAYEQTERDRAEYAASKLPVFKDEQLFADIAFLPMHVAAGCGRLRLMQNEERPGPQDIVLYRTIPAELPRVAGMITGERQTPLSHVNLRAVQDDVPNAYVRGAADDPLITALIDKFVHYQVTADGYTLREATRDEVERWFADKRGKQAQTPRRNLEATAILPFTELGFANADSIGVKAANLAALHDIGLPAGMVPDGFAVPFSFYDTFMRETGLFEAAKTMLAQPGFADDARARERALSDLRKQIEKAEMPAALQQELAAVQAKFPAGTPIRCRSSTNNEDLPGFSGAGLYDSFTHKPDAGPLQKTVQRVFASLWNFRAVEEREFYRVDHLATAMGVVLQPSYRGELANGVAVTDDVAYQTTATDGRRFYVNVQVGEDLVTNPEAASVPEELLLHPSNARRDAEITRSNRVGDGKSLLNEAHRQELRAALVTIHRKFRTLYGARLPFAMEIEFKITAEGKLAIKQARPWVQ